MEHDLNGISVIQLRCARYLDVKKEKPQLYRLSNARHKSSARICGGTVKNAALRAAICFAGAFWRFLRPTTSNFEFWQLNDNRNLARFLAIAAQSFFPLGPRLKS